MNKKVRQKKTNLQLSIGLLAIVFIIGALLVRGNIGETGVVGEFKGMLEEKAGKVRKLIWKRKVKFSGEELAVKEAEVTALEYKVLRLTKENEALRAQLEAPLPATLDMLPAEVVGIGRFMFIDKGRQEAVEVGMAVIAKEVLVGEVIQVAEKTAKIRLATDLESKIPVRTERGALGILTADNQGRLWIQKVLQREELKPGDLVGTSGMENFPSGILVGKIGRLVGSEREVYKRAVVEPEVDYKRLLYVFVVK